MKEDIKKLIIDNAGLTLKDWALINPDRMSEKLESHFKEFIQWESENAYRFEYYTRAQVYDIWKNRE
jgi:hypothetical protein